MYKAVTLGAGIVYTAVGLLFAGYAPLLLMTAVPPSQPFPPAEGVDLLWSSFGVARVFGAVLAGAGFMFLSACNLETQEAKKFALASISLLSACGLAMSAMQAWAVIPHPAAWAIVGMFAVGLVASLAVGRSGSHSLAS